MKRIAKPLLILPLVGLLSFMALNSQNIHLLTIKNSVSCNHEGNHYLASTASDTLHGCDEYWVCCKCKQHWSEYPGTGQFVNKTSSGLEIPEEFVRHHYELNELCIRNTPCTVKNCTSTQPLDVKSVVLSDYFEQTGASAKLVKGSPSWAAPYTKENGLAWNLGSEDRNTKDIKMPRIRYSDFENVQFHLKTNGNLGKIFSIGINSATDLFYYVDYTDILIDVTNIDGKLQITATNLDEQTKKNTVTYTGPAINGTDCLTIKAEGLHPDIIVGLYDLRLNHVHDNKASIPATDKIGYKRKACSVCGTAFEEESTEIMKGSDANFVKYDYGAHIMSTNGGPHIGFMNHDNEGLAYEMLGIIDFGVTEFSNYLPLTNYSLYSSVVFNAKIICPSDSVYYAMDEWDLIDVRGNANANITVKKQGNAYNATITVNGYGSDSLTVTDADILSGNESLTFHSESVTEQIEFKFIITGVTLTI